MGLGTLKRHRRTGEVKDDTTGDTSMKKKTDVPAIDALYVNAEPFTPSDADLKTNAKVIDNAEKENTQTDWEGEDMPKTDKGMDVTNTLETSLDAGAEKTTAKEHVEDKHAPKPTKEVKDVVEDKKEKGKKHHKEE